MQLLMDCFGDCYASVQSLRGFFMTVAGVFADETRKLEKLTDPGSEFAESLEPIISIACRQILTVTNEISKRPRPICIKTTADALDDKLAMIDQWVGAIFTELKNYHAHLRDFIFLLELNVQLDERSVLTVASSDSTEEHTQIREQTKQTKRYVYVLNLVAKVYEAILSVQSEADKPSRERATPSLIHRLFSRRNA